MKNKARHRRIKHSAIPPTIIDSAFFESHPDKDQYRRKVVRDEVPDSLGKRHVFEVDVFRITNGIFLRAFINKNGRVIGEEMSINDALYSTPAARQVAQFCKNLFAELMALKSIRGR